MHTSTRCTYGVSGEPPATKGGQSFKAEILVISGWVRDNPGKAWGRTRYLAERSTFGLLWVIICSLLYLARLRDHAFARKPIFVAGADDSIGLRYHSNVNNI